MTKIDLITGILGSGKTTFLRKYAKHFIDRGEHIAILENDFGAVNVDMVMLQDLKCENCQLEMVSGGGDAHCHRRRFRTQLIALGMQHLDRVIVEPSGIFDMDEFFDTLYDPPLDRWFEIGSVLTVIDAEMPELLSAEMEYLLASEASCSGKLLLSKLSSVPDEPHDRLSARILSHVNRALAGIQCRRVFRPEELLMREWDTLTADDLDALSRAGYRKESYVKQYSTESIGSSVHYFMHVSFPEEEIEPMIRGIFDDAETGTVYRIKGSVPRKNGLWLKLNATREKIELSPVPEGQAVLIVIGDGISRAAIDRHLLAVNQDPAYVSI